jgi:hypothetical protein
MSTIYVYVYPPLQSITYYCRDRPPLTANHRTTHPPDTILNATAASAELAMNMKQYCNAMKEDRV